MFGSNGINSLPRCKLKSMLKVTLSLETSIHMYILPGVLHTTITSCSLFVGWWTHAWGSVTELWRVHVRLLCWWWWRRWWRGWWMAWRIVTSLLVYDTSSHIWHTCRLTQLSTSLCVCINHTTCAPCSFHQFRLYCIAGAFCRRRFNELFKGSLVLFTG